MSQETKVEIGGCCRDCNRGFDGFYGSCKVATKEFLVSCSPSGHFFCYLDKQDVAVLSS